MIHDNRDTAPSCTILVFGRPLCHQACHSEQVPLGNFKSGAPTFAIFARLDGIQQAIELAACAEGDVPWDSVHLQEARVDDLLQCDRQVVIAGI